MIEIHAERYLLKNTIDHTHMKMHIKRFVQKILSDYEMTVWHQCTASWLKCKLLHFTTRLGAK